MMTALRVVSSALDPSVSCFSASGWCRVEGAVVFVIADRGRLSWVGVALACWRATVEDGDVAFGLGHLHGVERVDARRGRGGGIGTIWQCPSEYMRRTGLFSTRINS